MTAGTGLDNAKLYYFDYSRTGGIAEPIKMLLEDFEVKHEYIQVQANEEEWDNGLQKEILKREDKPFDCLPYLETEDGKRYFCSGPILRFVAKRLGMLDGLNEEEIQFLDSVQDLAFDWYVMFAMFSARAMVTPENQKAYPLTRAPKQANRLNRLYGVHEGPYILGSKISYCDYAVYHAIDDQRSIIGDLQTYPHLAKLVEAFEERPIIKKYLAALPKKASDQSSHS